MARTAFVFLVLVGVLGACAAGPNSKRASYEACLAAPDAACVAQIAAQEVQAMEPGPGRADAAMEAASSAQDAGLPGQLAELMALAEADVLQITEPKKKAAMLVKLANAYADNGLGEKAAEVAAWTLQSTSTLTDPVSKVDVTGKALVVYAKLGAFDAAVQRTARLAEDPETAASFKARTFHDIAALQAKAGQFEAARATLEQATMGLQYYPATALTDVAAYAFLGGEEMLADELLTQAADMGRELNDAYFVSGTLRHAAEAYSKTGRQDKARGLYLEAIARVRAATAEDGAGPGTLAAAIQSRARAISRVATAQAESGFVEDARAALEHAQGLAAAEPNEAMRHYANYEIAGSLAFAGSIEAATSLSNSLPETPFGDAQSLRSAAQRDIAWAKASQGDVAGGLTAALAIATSRERVAALGRISRSLANPNMGSSVRYL